MGTEYTILKKGKFTVDLFEGSNEFTVFVSDDGVYCDTPPTTRIEVTDLLAMAAELIKVASYFEPEADKLATMLRQGCPDGYTEQIIKDVAVEYEMLF